MTGHLALYDYTVDFAGTAGTGCTGLTGHAVLHDHSQLTRLTEMDLAHMFDVLTLEVHCLHGQHISMGTCHGCVWEPLARELRCTVKERFVASALTADMIRL